MPNEPLWPFLIIDGLSGDELVEAYRRIYLENYVFDNQGVRRLFQDWTGASVSFSDRAFDHAFSETSGYREGLDHEHFSLSRAQRMLWIREVLACSRGTINRFQQQKMTDRGRQTKRRTFVVCEESYVVVLDNPRKPEAPFQFVTAFHTPDMDYLKRIAATSALLECRKGKG